MPVPIVAAAGAVGQLAGTIGTAIADVGDALGIHSASPRYAGGPLVSWVNAGIARISGGDLQTIRDWDTARKTAKDAAAWQQVWNVELPRIGLNAQQLALVRLLDTQLAGTPAASLASLPTTPSSVGTAAAAAAAGLFSGSMGTVLIVVLVIVAGLYFLRRRG